MSDDPLYNKDRYTLAFAPSMGLAFELVCRHCGVVVHMPSKDDEPPSTTDVHDTFHDRFDEMWVTHHSLLLERAERMDRGDG